MARGRGRGRVGAEPAPSGGRGRGRGHAGGGSVASFLAPHTGKQASHIANAEAGTEYNPAIREDREQAKGSRKREADLGQWYAQLASDYQGAQNAGAAALQSVENTTTSQLAEAGQRSAKEQGELAAQDEQFASLVGGPKDTPGLAKIAEAAQAAGAARVDQSKPLLSEQANFVAQLGGDKAAARAQGIEARTAEQGRRDKIIKDLGATRREKGQAAVSNKEKIRESDRTQAAEIAKLKLARKEARTAAASAAASQALAQVESSRKAQQDAISNRQSQEGISISRKSAQTSRITARATAKHYEHENKGGLTTAERRSKNEHSADAMAAAKALLGIKVPKSAKEWSQFEVGLIEKIGSSYSADAAKAVAALRALQKQKAATRKSDLHRGLVPGH